MSLMYDLTACSHILEQLTYSPFMLFHFARVCIRFIDDPTTDRRVKRRMHCERNRYRCETPFFVRRSYGVHRREGSDGEEGRVSLVVCSRGRVR